MHGKVVEFAPYKRRQYVILICALVFVERIVGDDSRCFDISKAGAELSDKDVNSELTLRKQVRNVRHLDSGFVCRFTVTC